MDFLNTKTGVSGIDGPFSIFTIIPILSFIVFVIIIFVIVATIIFSLRLKAKNDAAPRLKSQAKVISRRTDVHGVSEGSTHTDYYITFEFEQGSRQEFQVDDYNYGVLIEGDIGILEHQGNRYLGFERTRS